MRRQISPHSEEAEKAVIGSILSDNNQYDSCHEYLPRGANREFRPF